MTILLGVNTLGAKVICKDIDPYSAYIEWILFNLSFYIFGVMSNIMPYEDVVVNEDSYQIQLITSAHPLSVVVASEMSSCC